jgi:hypothetical protein
MHMPDSMRAAIDNDIHAAGDPTPDDVQVVSIEQQTLTMLGQLQVDLDTKASMLDINALHASLAEVKAELARRPPYAVILTWLVTISLAAAVLVGTVILTVLAVR